ncbi:integrase [Erwinia sp.]|uniref:integrase n=1 Tax=Erwinia citreus TaxID=558 RepID=UPI003C78525A
MVSKANSALREDHSLDVRSLSGDQLHRLETHADAEYLVIDLGNAKTRSPAFNETMKVAMQAALSAVLASLSQTEVALKKSTPSSRMKSLAVVPESQQQTSKEARAARNAQRREQLNDRILADSVWLTARELSEKANFQSSNPSAGPNRWKSSGSIFALQLQGKDNYPEYALDEGFRPIPVVKQVISLFGEKKTPWGLAIWFGSENSWLGGKKPKDVLASQPKQVLLAAQAEREGAVHG